MIKLRRKLLSIFCAAVLALELLPLGALAAPAVGETLTYRNMTASITGSSYSGVSFTVAPAETIATTYHTFYLYSPTERLAPSWFYTSHYVYNADWNFWWGADLSVGYPGEADIPKDAALQDLYIPAYPVPLGGVQYYAVDHNESDAVLPDVGGEILSGGLSLRIRGISDQTGTHLFVPGGNLCAGAEPSIASLRVNGLGESVEKTAAFTLTLPEVLPETADFFLYHIFLSDDGVLSVTGGDASQSFLCAGYDEEGRMLEVKSLSIDERADSLPGGYPCDPRWTTELGDLSASAVVKLFALNADGSPAGPSATLSEEIASIDLATWGDQSKKGSASLSVTGVSGDALLREANETYLDEDARLISAVDASINGGVLENGDVAELRFQYRSDDLSDKELGAAALLPAWYNKDYYDEQTETYGRWEPETCYFLDEESSEVVVLTDHFSDHALFEVNGSGTRHAIVTGLNASRLSSLSEDVALKIIQGINQNPNMNRFDRAKLFLGFLNGTLNNNWILGADATNTLLDLMVHAAEGTATNSFFAGVGTAIGGIGVAGAAVKVATTAYTKGTFSYDTFQAVTEGGISTGAFAASKSHPAIGISLLVINLMKWSGEYLVGQYNKNTDARFEKLLKAYNRKREGGEAYWKKQLAAPFSKYLSDIKTDTYADSVSRYLDSVDRLVDHYALAFYDEYRAGGISGAPTVNTANLNLCADVCDRYKVELKKQIAPILEYYAGLATQNALKSMQADLDEKMTELNRTVTLNFREAGTVGLAKDCYALFTGADRTEWRVDFDKNGAGTLSFTLFAYLERGLPKTISVFEKDGNAPRGVIALPEALWQSPSPAGEYTVNFAIQDQVKTFYIVEQARNYGEPFLYAGMTARLSPLSAGADGFSVRLDNTGVASLTLSTNSYRAAGSPSRLEVVNGSGTVVYATNFDFSQDRIFLRDDSLRVHVSCADETSIQHYAGQTATLTAVRGNQVREQMQTEIDKNGKALLMLPEPEQVWMEGTYRFFVSDGSSTPQELAFGLAKSDTSMQLQFDGNGECTVILQYADQEDENAPILELAESSVVMYKDQMHDVRVLQGEIGQVSVRDRKVAVASRDYISAVGEGQTIITFTDKNHPDCTVEVAVEVSNETPDVSGYYRRVQTYYRSTTDVPKYDVHENTVQNYPNGTTGDLVYIQAGYAYGHSNISMVHESNCNDDGTFKENQTTEWIQPANADRMYGNSSGSYWMIYTGYSFYAEIHGDMTSESQGVYNTWERHYFYWWVPDPRLSDEPIPEE